MATELAISALRNPHENMSAFLGASVVAFGGAKNASRPWANRAHKPASKHVSLWSQEGASYCGGEYSLCTDGSCALTQSACGKCALPTSAHIAS